MDEPIQALSALTSSAGWPDRWLTIPEFIERLDRLGWWRQQGLRGETPERKRAFLRAALEVGADQGAVLWARVGALYKHVVRLSEDDFRALSEFNTGTTKAASPPFQVAAAQ
jgi:hypothetical protein